MTFQLTEAFVEASKKLGVQVKIGTVEGVECIDGKVKRVKVGDEYIDADIVIVAMGPWSYKAGKNFHPFLIIELAKWLPLPFLEEFGHKAHSITLKPKVQLTPTALFIEYKSKDGKFYEPEFYPRKSKTLFVINH